MSAFRMGTIGLASLSLIAVAMARTETDSTSESPQTIQAPVQQPPPAAAPIVRGRGGVGFAGPNQKMQVAVIQQLLKIGDDDWEKLGPKVEKVLAAKQNMSTGAGMNWTARNDARPVIEASGARPDTAPGKAMQAVRDALAEEKATDEQLAKTMTAVREARKKARADYEAAQRELIDALTPRQQALLMTLGVVE